ncbi:MAG: DUF1611 domain-containing protein [Candidatus Thermoplasmatota archaeon]|nr:DUF1611 domain-containing protein [Candidatus Thermoplasmatota archaeon]
MTKTVILTDEHLDQGTAKTAHGLLRHSEKYEIVGVIDSKFAGKRTDEVLSRCKPVKIYPDLPSVLDEKDVENLIVGVATVGGYLPENFKEHIEEAVENGLDIISGLHYFLSEDEQLKEMAEEHGVELKDIRKSPPLEELHYFQNRKEEIDALTIPFLGTDSSVGKRTALLETYKALKKRDNKVEWVATGQTGLLQGADYGLPLDSIEGDYMVGELEHQIWRAWEENEPDFILIEGQGSISHPAYVCGSRAILSASQPDGVVLQHDPARPYRHYKEDELHWPMPELDTEIELIKKFSGSDVIAITLNPVDLTEEEKEKYIIKYEQQYHVPSADALEDPGKIANRIEVQDSLN